MLCFAVFFGLFSVYDVLLLFLLSSLFVVSRLLDILTIMLYDLNDCVACSRKVGRRVLEYV